jgi:hypothetical protein
LGTGSLGLVPDTDGLKRKKRSKGKLASGATAAVSAGQSSPAAVVSAGAAQTVGSPAAPAVAGSGSAGARTPVAVPGRVTVQW